MAIALRHLFQSSVPDRNAAGLIKPSQWNENHIITLAPNKVIGRTSTGTGNAEELGGKDGIEITGGAIRISATGVVAGSYSNPDITVNARGQITSIQNGASFGYYVNLAREWAENAEDVAVIDNPGHYSSRHWAAKSEDHAAVASAYVTDALTAKSGAEAAQGLAETAQGLAEAALDAFDDIYLGAKASDPTLDNDGDALVEGQLYWNTSANALRIYDGAAWQAYSASSGISNVVEDATPQLGGDLDLNSHDITGTGDINITGSVTVTDDAYDATGWNGSAAVPTKNAIRDKVEAVLSDYASTANAKGASLVGIEDAGGLITATTVEAALAELAADVAALDAAVILKGTWDASSGSFPGSGSAQAGWSYIVSVGGTVNGVAFVANDRILAIADNASTSTYAANWHKLDYTDQVLSVDGQTGAVDLSGIYQGLDATLTAWAGITVTQGGLFYGTGADAFAVLAKDTNSTRYLSNQGSSNNPSWNQIDLSNGVTGDLPFANLTQGSALSVLGVTGNSTADVASIAAGSDHQVLRRSGTSVAFGAVDLSQAAAVIGLLPAANVTGVLKQGVHTIWVPASAMWAKSTNGAGSTDYDSGANDITVKGSLAFDTTTQEYAQFLVAMPKSWDNGTVTFIPYWTNTGGSSTQTVVWSLAGRALGDSDAIDGTFGTAQTSSDTWEAQNDLHIGPESSAITIGNTPAQNDMVVFEVSRVVGSDNMSGDALLLGIKVLININAANDA